MKKKEIIKEMKISEGNNKLRTISNEYTLLIRCSFTILIPKGLILSIRKKFLELLKGSTLGRDKN